MSTRVPLRFGAAFLSSLVLAMLMVPALAAAATIQTDLWVYQDGDTVTVSGVDFGPNELVDFVTTDPEGTVVDTGSASSDELGGVVHQFILHVTVGGIYDVVGTGRDSGLTASTEFDPPVVSVSPASWDYGSIDVGTSSVKTFTISNGAGGTSMNVQTVTSSSPEFVVGGITTPVNGIGAGGSTTFTVTFTPAASGERSGTISIATNGANPSVPVTGQGIATDTTPPTVVIDSASDSLLNAAELSTNVTWHANENGAYSVRVGATTCANGTEVASGTYSTSPATVVTNVLASALLEGSNTVRVCVTDAATNTGSDATSVTKDTVAPTISIDHTADGESGWNISDPVAEAITASDNTSGIAGINCSDTLFGIGVVSGSEPNFGADVSGEGIHGLSCTATDAAGNQSQAATDSVKIDTISPAATLSVSSGTAGANGWYTSNVTVSTTGSDATSDLDHCSGEQFQTAETAGATFNGSCTDVAGNVGTAVALEVKLDKTGPSANLAIMAGTLGLGGYYVSDVTVRTTGADSISDPTGCSADQFLTTDTTGTAFNGSCTNDAGLTTNAAPLSVKLDKTAPTIRFGDRAPMPNAFGWANEAVLLTWSCEDATSGPLDVSDSHVVPTEGLNQTATGDCYDVAGNHSSDTQDGVSIDTTDPAIAFLNQTPPANSNGWNRSTVTLHWSCSDALSGPVDASLDDVLSSEGADQTSTATCVDKADNDVQDTQVDIDIDLTDPIITLVSRTPANANGWNNTDVSLSWSCDDALSGVEATTVSETVTGEGANQTATGTCIDLAGNSVSDTVSTINIDKTAPSISGSRSPTANANGWNNANVTTHYTCSDGLSGVASLTADQVVSTEGAGQSRSGTCVDRADNSAGTTVSDINIDKTAPSVAITTPADGSATIQSTVDVSGTRSDNLSGFGTVAVNGVPATLASGTFSRPSVVINCGPNTITALATDQAGNTADQSITVTKLCYGISFLSPLDQSTTTPMINTGKYGRVIPVKVVISLNGVSQSDASLAALGLNLEIGVNGASCASGAAMDALEEYADAGSSNDNTNDFRWDTGKWIYNLNTGSPPGGVAMTLNRCYRFDVYVNDSGPGHVLVSSTPYAIFKPTK